MGLSFNPALAAGKFTTGVCEKEFAGASKRYGVPVAVLTAVGMTETGRGDGLRPYALNINGDAVYDLSRNEAVLKFHEARQKGIKLIDVGCMQINHYYHKQHFRSVNEMLDPARNVDYSARFLRRLYDQEKNWTRAVARYHAGDRNLPAQKRYVCAVIGKLVHAKLGGWTPEAARFCGVKMPSKKRTTSTLQSRRIAVAKEPWGARVSRAGK